MLPDVRTPRQPWLGHSSRGSSLSSRSPELGILPLGVMLSAAPLKSSGTHPLQARGVALGASNTSPSRSAAEQPSKFWEFVTIFGTWEPPSRSAAEQPSKF